MDIISETLNSMQVSGNLLLNEDYAAPWAVSIPNKAKLIDSLNLDKNSHIAAFHLVQRGYIEIMLENGDSAVVNAGEIVICFSGMAHNLSQGAKIKPLPFEKLLQNAQNIFKPNSNNVAQSTSLICGVFMLHNTFLNPLFESLPALLKISTSPGHDLSISDTASIVNLLLNEIHQHADAQHYMIGRYLELLCANAIRHYLDSEPHNSSGLLSALKDSSVAQAISNIHSQPANHWSVAKLAKIVSLSPSRFAARFTQAMDLTPMVYLTRWRMYLASTLLNETKLTIEQIALKVGYENVAAFSRAFKRYIGTPPGAWRAANRQHAISHQH